MSSTLDILSFQDRIAEAGAGAGENLHYSYRLVIGEVEVAQSPEADVFAPGTAPSATRLLANIPNPFNPNTTIHFELAQPSEVEVSVYDVMGRKVRVLVEGERAAGLHAPVWDGRDQSGRQVSSGAYYVRLITEGKIDRRKITLVK